MAVSDDKIESYVCWRGCRNEENGRLLLFSPNEVERVLVCTHMRIICRSCFVSQMHVLKQCYSCKCWFNTLTYRYLYLYVTENDNNDRGACMTCMRKYAANNSEATRLIGKNYSSQRLTRPEELDMFRLFIRQIFQLSDFKRNVLAQPKKRRALIHIRNYFPSLGDKAYFLVEHMTEKQLDMLNFKELTDIDVICAFSNIDACAVKKSYENFKFI
jgi:hypothetical protein